jgi:hypothetical protein
MEVRVLKVRGQANLNELREVISIGHTVAWHELGGWQTPAPTKVGDLVVWYSGAPHQEFVAYGWACGPPRKPQDEKVKHYGPVCAVAPLPGGSKPRAEVGARSGFMADADEVVPMAQTVPGDRIIAFLRALGFSAGFVDMREQISAEVARCIETVGDAL